MEDPFLLFNWTKIMNDRSNGESNKEESFLGKSISTVVRLSKSQRIAGVRSLCCG